MKNIIILTLSFLPEFVLKKFENLFSISQGKGFSKPIKESKLVIKFIKKKNINLKNIFDIGSFKGKYIDQFSKEFKNLDIYLIEPENSNYRFLKKKYKNHRKIKILNFAASNINKKKNFFHTAKAQRKDL